jgi:oligosaccharyltransferase complex subunit alpha (ribophorin I)
MRPVSWAAALLGCAATLVSAEKSNTSEHLSSQNILPAFKPSPVFKNANLVHIISLEKGYPKETVNVVIENISNEPQDEYYIPFTAEQMEKIGDLEVRDKKVPELGLFAAEAAEIDTERFVYSV